MAPAIGPPPLLASSASRLRRGRQVPRCSRGPCDRCDSCGWWCLIPRRVGADRRTTRFRHARWSRRLRPPPRGRRSCPPTARRPPGWSARTRAASAASRSNAGAGSSPRGRHRHEARAAAGRRAPATASASAGTSPGAAPPRAASSPAGSPEVDLDAAPRPGGSALLARPGRARAARDAPVDGVHDRAEPGDGGGLVPLQLADEVPAQRRGRPARPPCRAAPGPGSRRSPRCPSAASARTSSAGQVLLTASSAHRRRVAAGRPGGGVDPRPDRAQVLRQVGHAAIFPAARRGLSRARRGRPAGR